MSEEWQSTKESRLYIPLLASNLLQESAPSRTRHLGYPQPRLGPAGVWAHCDTAWHKLWWVGTGQGDQPSGGMGWASGGGLRLAVAGVPVDPPAT